MQADSVERFIVVHGQIILNQFKHFPNKAVQKAAFVTELRNKMETRKHSKLYMSKVQQTVRMSLKANTNVMYLITYYYCCLCRLLGLFGLSSV